MLQYRMNTTITLTNDPAHITSAIKWCNRHVGDGRYLVDNQWPSSYWNFRFNDTLLASQFALRWA